MELLFVIVIAAGIGGAVRYLIPQRGTYGLLLLPAVGAITVDGLVFDGERGQVSISASGEVLGGSLPFVVG